jgi:hypothetical protein
MAVADRRDAAQGREAQGLLIGAETGTRRRWSRIGICTQDKARNGVQWRAKSVLSVRSVSLCRYRVESAGGPVCLNYSRRDSVYPV